MQEREAKFRELDAMLQAGQDDIDAGRVFSAEEVFSDLRDYIDQIERKAS